MPAFEEIQRLNLLIPLAVLSVETALSIWVWRYFKLARNRRLLLIICLPYLFFVGLVGMFALQSLETRIDETGIHYRYFPGFLKTRDITWDEIYYTEIVTFKPWYKEVSRGAMASDRHKNEYTISGTVGLKIVLKNATMLIIGTQKPNELKGTLLEMEHEGITGRYKFYD